MAVLPAEIPTGLVTGHYYFVNEDNIDADTDPELTVVTGTVRFIASVKTLRMPSKKAVLVPLTFDGVFDSQGNLTPLNGTGVGMELPATNSPLFTEQDYTWRVEFNLKEAGTTNTVNLDSFDIQVPVGSTQDLSELIPVAATAGVLTLRGPKGDDGPAGTVTDASVAAALDQPLTKAALSGTIATREGSTYAAYPFMAKLVTGGQNLTMLNLSDSTGSAADGYLSQTLDWLQASYPEYGSEYVDWDHVAKVWSPAVTRQTGTNGFKISAWNGGREGMQFEYPIAFLKTMVGRSQPDLIFINFGHNMGALNTGFESHISRLVCSVQAWAPRATIVLCTQNPRLDGLLTPEVSRHRANIVRDMAGLLGCGFIDWYRAFIDTGDAAAYTRADKLHPNELGQQLMTETVKDFMRWRPYGQPLPSVDSGFMVTGRNLAPNGNLAKWTTSPGAPDGWLATGLASITKDTVNFESANGYAAKMTMNGTEAGKVSCTVQKNNIQGKWVTAAARFYIPPGSHANAGKLQLGTTISLGSSTTSTEGGWKWEVISVFFPLDYASNTTVTAYASSSAAAVGDVWLDRLIVCAGLVPHDA